MKLGKHNTRTLSLVIEGWDSKQLYSLHNNPISTSCGVHNNRCPSLCTENYQPDTCDQFLFSITSPHTPPSVSTHIFNDEWLVCYLKGYLLDIKFIREVTLSLGLLSHSNPSFIGIPYNKEILLNLGMKCWNPTFNAQGLSAIIVAVHVGAVKIYVAAVKALTKKERGGRRQDKTQFSLPQKLMVFWISHLP